ncbi:MAG: chemotaxis protein CheX [Pirellulaceae bacterium]
MSESNNPLIPPPEVVEAFTSAAITTLQELIQLEAFAETTDPAVTDFAGEVVLATVRLERSNPGMMTLVIEGEVAWQLASRYLPARSQLNKEIIDDVVGEFANVIAGQAKTILKGTPYHFLMSIPVVTRSDGIAASATIVPGAVLVASLGTEEGRVLVFASVPSCPGG